MSKAGDTIEDSLEDGISPNPKTHLLNENPNEGAMKGFSFKVIENDLERIKNALDQSENSNRINFLQTIEDILKEN